MVNIMTRFEKEDFPKVKAFALRNNYSLSRAISLLTMKGLKNDKILL